MSVSLRRSPLRFLRNFSLRKCSKLTDEAVLSFAETARRLETLDLAGCEKITDAGGCGTIAVRQFAIATAVVGCAAISFARRGGCYCVGGRRCCCDLGACATTVFCLPWWSGIDSLVKGCEQLRSVDCTACYVSDEALKSIGCVSVCVCVCVCVCVRASATPPLRHIIKSRSHLMQGHAAAALSRV